MKRICYLCLLVLLSILIPVTALAAEDQSIKYNINGVDIPQEVLGAIKILK